MTSRDLNENKSNNIRIDVSRTILAFVLVTGIYGFFTNEHTAAKLLAMGGSLGVLFLLIMSFKSPSKSKNK